TVQADRKDPFVWYAAGPNGETYPLPLSRFQDDMPQCYTFLEPVQGKPVKLVVGHYNGASVFELTDRGARRTRLCTGHQGPVTVAADQTWMVTASRDQTVSAFSLQPWKQQAELGARFGRDKAGRLWVDGVDRLSPASEAGLLVDDEVVVLAVNGRKVFDRIGY